MTDQNEVIELEPDEPPTNGVWVETCDVIPAPTNEELALGKLLGETANSDDDEVGSLPDGMTGIRGFASVAGKSDRDAAFSKARDIKECMLDYGVPEVDIRLRPGRPNSFGVWDAGFFVSDMSHHTVSRFGSNLTPVLGLCENGRSDLPGPLSNGYGGYDLTYRILSLGYANHPGYGGPIRVPALTAGSFVIPKDSARRYAFGTEWEGGLNSLDWNRVLRNPRNKKEMTMREFMGRANAALTEVLEIHPNAHLEHSTWTPRKIDRLGYSQNEGIAEANKYRRAKDLPEIDISNIQREFQRYLDGKEPQKLYGVKVIQRSLNRQFKAGLKPDGIVKKKTVEAWMRFEDKAGGRPRVHVPDKISLNKLVKDTYKVKR